MIPHSKREDGCGAWRRTNFLRWRQYRRTTDLDYATCPRTNREPEVVQLYNRGHEVQAETQA